ncbi:protein sidekick-1-like [Poecilia latipinna]|uniref:protein sidekick-1-like n=1 Tax=Poecilia latipinna TaxID=48699 RepID=UPI00072E8E5D|nr:PREDICTED: protein sidekick-1-like [Poecilia latipinna]
MTWEHLSFQRATLGVIKASPVTSELVMISLDLVKIWLLVMSMERLQRIKDHQAVSGSKAMTCEGTNDSTVMRGLSLEPAQTGHGIKGFQMVVHLSCLATAKVAPYLQGGERGQQVVLEGNRLVLTCPAGGSWPLQYRWTLNNTNITDWTPQYRLSVPSLQRADAGLYQCMVRNRMGAVIHRRTEVQVAFLGNFTSGEQRKTATQGRAVIISPPPLASFPQPLVTWYKDGHKIIPNNRL